MAVRKEVGKRVLGIDANTNSIAFCLIWNKKPQAWGKLTIEGKDIYERIGDAYKKTELLIKMYDFDFCAIEGAVMVRNQQTAKKLAYTFGAIISAMASNGVKIVDVSPMTWQNYIGNKILTPPEKLAIRRKHPGKSKSWYSTKSRTMRKQRTLDYFNKKFGLELVDDDIGDSFGLSWYAYNNLTKRR